MATGTTLTYEQLALSFLAWAQTEPSLRAAAIIGSQARSDHPADPWSDLDIMVFASDVEPYIAGGGWAEQIAPVWLSFVERTPDGQGWERRVLYAGGLDVDFALLPAAWLSAMAETEISPDMADVIRRGYRILLDKDGLLEEIVRRPLPQAPPFQPPTETAFLNAVHDFWYHSLWTIRHLRRGELWWAKSGCDGRLKALLHQMLEWHAQAMGGPATDTWMRGRFLEEWADPRAVAQLRHAFAHYDAEDIARALLSTMDLFRWLAIEVAESWRYPYPTQSEQETVRIVQALAGPLVLPSATPT